MEEEDDLLDEALNAESSETPAAADVQAEDAPVENNLTEAALDDQNSTDEAMSARCSHCMNQGRFGVLLHAA